MNLPKRFRQERVRGSGGQRQHRQQQQAGQEQTHRDGEAGAERLGPDLAEPSERCTASGRAECEWSRLAAG